MKNTVRPQPSPTPKNPQTNSYIRQAVILIVTTGISWLDLRLGVSILILKLLWIYWSWRKENIKQQQK